MSINNRLVRFAQQELVLSHNDAERARIAASLTQLEKVLKDRLGARIAEFVRFGSFTRNTILPRKYDPHSDIDLMVVFKTENGVMTPGTYRKYIQDVLTAAYPNSISRKDFPVIKLELNHIMFDVVPAYEDRGFFSSYSYRIPGSGDTWMGTKPNDINPDLSDKNQRVGNNTIRNVIRLCKHWNASAGYPLSSYLMEKDILNVSFWGSDDTYSGFLKALRSVGGHIPRVNQALNFISQYSGGWFSEDNEVKRMEWVRKLLPGLSNG